MSDKAMSTADLTSVLAELPGWAHESDALLKTFTFANFREAMAFMVRVGFEAEAMDHHPEWTNVYDEVKIRLTTHHSGNKVTAKDVELAKVIEKVRDVQEG
ncbi:4a-hydroxytetrahydrobiopterin dehydratase [Actomonas aquatica]|uniref:Putative pterin-4-alpha-carbinolamine dehydratase n=1 Tax=Actomonas aquatica TaxID=2866162 RepID=A0ABZ1CAQ6_9BACT|nr:4a-hydroxytetrahydrobiopterin dehydratase [Opitutus sp. WL0086]WRQ87390.1 4a-hydroxytetrahydrobiopterin dehydratase [Opitutus sp. WL0086]